MKYSFLVPTYNSDRWIQPCINSILAQTYSGFDIIIFDTGSTDGTLAWIKSLENSRIRICTTDVRLGIVENWQRFTTVKRNEYMTIMGHDDLLYPDYLATIDKLIEKHPDAGLYQTHFNFIDGKGELIRACAPMNAKLTPAAFLASVLQNTLEITATGFMVRSKDYDAIGGIPPYPSLLFADIELWLSLIMKSYLAVAPKNCFGFRLHIDNTSKATGEFRIVAFDMLTDFFYRLKIENKDYKTIIEKYAPGFLKNYVTGGCHKLIYISKNNRNGISMNTIIESAKKSAQKLLPGFYFKPEKYAQITLAKIIDGNTLLRSVFLFYKSFKKRTF